MASIDYHPSATFQGAADGFVYQNGPRGLGYYKDTTTQDYLQTDLGAPQTEERGWHGVGLWCVASRWSTRALLSAE